MSQIQKKFIKDNAVNEAKLRLSNDGALRARNAADSADVSLLKLDASDILKLLKLPRLDSALAAPADAKDIVPKEYVDGEISTVAGDLTTLEGRVTDIEDSVGAVNGIASLDGNGKVPVSQLPNSIMQYQGLWNASTNSPTLSNTGNAAEDLGNVYRVSAAGSVNFGAGSISFEAGDYVILGASGWEKADGTDAVTSVNGQSGAVSLDSDDIAEGSSNLYFTDARAKAAAVADSITNGVTDVAPSQNAVFDEFAAKQTLIDALEAASVEFQAPFKKVLDSTDISNGYVDLPVLAIGNSINAFVDRLAIHQTDDYTLSTVAGKTRITFTGSLVTPGQESLSVGDVIRVKYAKLAIS